MSGPVVFRTVAGVLAAVLFVGLGVGFYKAARSGPEPSDLPVLQEVSGFTLTDQHGRQVSLKDLRGSIWVADFIFTRCSGPCPRMTMGMKRLQDVFDEAPDVKLVSFTVDPDYDTSEILRDYAEGYGADPDQWVFLTGEAKKIRTMAREDFLLGTPEASKGDPIIHSNYFVLIDDLGRVRGYYHGVDEKDRARLSADIRKLRGDQERRG